MTGGELSARDSACAAVIVAAGDGRRMGFDKVFAPLAGKPLIRWSVEAFAASDVIGEIIVVAAAARVDAMRAALDGLGVTKIVAGGATRQDSVAAGVAAVTLPLVAVHDGARPLVTPSLIARCVAAAEQTGAATAAEPLTDTLQRATDGRGTEVVPRDGLWRVQTPQVFETALLREALTALARDGVVATDETSAVLRLGRSSALIANADWNGKVTVPRDLPWAEWVLGQRGRGTKQF